jgi:hypothetical protein
MTLAGAILAPRNSYVDAHNAFNPEISFLTVIAALLGGANSVWGPMLGVVPLLLVKDYLSIAYSSHFSVLLGLILLGVVFFIPNGVLGLVRSGRAALASARLGGPRRGHKGGRTEAPDTAPAAATLADLFEALARRLRGAEASPAAALPPPGPHAAGNGLDRAAAHPESPHGGPHSPARKVAP